MRQGDSRAARRWSIVLIVLAMILGPTRGFAQPERAVTAAGLPQFSVTPQPWPTPAMPNTLVVGNTSVRPEPVIAVPAITPTLPPPATPSTTATWPSPAPAMIPPPTVTGSTATLTGFPQGGPGLPLSADRR